MSMVSERNDLSPQDPQSTPMSDLPKGEEEGQSLDHEGFLSLEMGFGKGINEKVILVTKGMTLNQMYKFSKGSS